MNSLCEQIKILIEDALSVEIPQDQAQQMKKHLETCSSCRAYARDLQAEEEALTSLINGLNPDITSFRQRLMENCVTYSKDLRPEGVALGSPLEGGEAKPIGMIS